MRKAKSIKHETRLSKEAFAPGGMTVADALRRADASLETMRGPCDATIDASLVKIETGFGPTATGRDGKGFDDLHRLASTIIDASIFAKDCEIDKAARALCQLTNLCKAQGAWDWIAVDLHIDALKLLRSVGATLGQGERDAVLDGLRQVTRKRVGDPDTLVA
jgi:hypothetical protein